MTRLSVKHLSVALGRRLVLSGIDLDLEPGCFTVVIGPNGAGKTTLIRALAGLVAPQAGAVTFDGVPVGRLRAVERARAIAYLAQGGTIAWPLPVTSVVALGRLPHGERPDALTPAGQEAVAAAIASVGLRGFEHRAVTELSGGERARVLLARALATQAPVLLADEPMAALDLRHQLVVLEVLRNRARAGATVVAVMHDLSLAARFADEIILLGEGHILARGAPAAVLTDARLASSFGVAARISTDGDRIFITADRPVMIDE
jgi:iron complex transport system ATP-binding protein